MDDLDTSNYEWKLIACDSGAQVISYPVPNMAVNDIIRVLCVAGNEDKYLPDKETANALCGIVGKRIDMEMLAKLTGLSCEYLEIWQTAPPNP